MGQLRQLLFSTKGHDLISHPTGSSAVALQGPRKEVVTPDPVPFTGAGPVAAFTSGLCGNDVAPVLGTALSWFRTSDFCLLNPNRRKTRD